MTKYKKFWDALEVNKEKPKYLRKIKVIDVKKFNSSIQSNNSSTNKIISNLYNGDIYLIKRAIKKKYLNNLKVRLTKLSQEKPSSFHKMKDGCPNFWRRQDEHIAKNYSFKSVRDSYYFFRWNKEKLLLWKNFDKIWGNIKFLGGLNKNQWNSNKPKDGIVDRIQVIRYPENSGHAVAHTHNTKNQRLAISLYMSKIKEDFAHGGAYFVNNKKKKINIEKFIDEGDIAIFYGSIIHGVDKVKLGKNIKLKNELLKGRWFCGLYSPESDEKKNRNTSIPSKEKFT